jgi:hypothetical protein
MILRRFCTPCITVHQLEHRLRVDAGDSAFADGYFPVSAVILPIVKHHNKAIDSVLDCSWSQSEKLPSCLSSICIELTTNFNTDPALLDVNGAVNALPDFCGENTTYNQLERGLLMSD